MAVTFSPVEELELYCRHCKKVMPAQLERSIAENGRNVDRRSTFEYFCAKCHTTLCYCGEDLLEAPKEDAEAEETRTYTASDTFYVGEEIHHPSFEAKGKIVGKDFGNPTRIMVSFEKLGMKKLVEGIGS